MLNKRKAWRFLVIHGRLNHWAVGFRLVFEFANLHGRRSYISAPNSQSGHKRLLWLTEHLYQHLYFLTTLICFILHLSKTFDRFSNPWGRFIVSRNRFMSTNNKFFRVFLRVSKSKWSILFWSKFLKPSPSLMQVVLFYCFSHYLLCHDALHYVCMVEVKTFSN